MAAMGGPGRRARWGISLLVSLGFGSSWACAPGGDVPSDSGGRGGERPHGAGGLQDASGGAHSGGHLASGGRPAVGGETNVGAEVGGSVASGGYPSSGGEAAQGGEGSGGRSGASCDFDCPRSEHPIVQIAAGFEHTCARSSDGLVKCWGRNNWGQLGLGDISSRGDELGEMGPGLGTVDLGKGRLATAIVAGLDHNCALLDDGAVKCWGWNGWGQLGQGDTNDRGDEANEMGDELAPIDLGSGRKAIAVTAGVYHSCALLDDGAVKCWGYNGSGQVGAGDTTLHGDESGEMGANLSAIALGNGRRAKRLVSGVYHNCVILDDDSVKCWGGNTYGQLGLGDANDRGDQPGELGDALPTIALDLERIPEKLVAGFAHTCAHFDDASVKCWGMNDRGQLGLGDVETRGDLPGEVGASLAAVPFGEVFHVTEVTAAIDSTCVLSLDARMKCWGSNNYGQLGLGDLNNRGDAPGEMGDALAVLQVASGRPVHLATGGHHSCAAFEDGIVKCWGNNNHGQLGLGDTRDRGDEPNEMGDNLPAVSLW